MTVINMGTPATARSLSTQQGHTYLNTTNPANADGIIDTIEVYFVNSTPANVKIGTFFNTGNGWKMRDHAFFASISVGSKQTLTGLNIAVQAGDVLGIWWENGAAAISVDGYDDQACFTWIDAFDGVARGVANAWVTTFSLSASGETVEAPSGWPNIGKVSGLAAAGISKINGVPAAHITKLNGITV